MKKIVSQYSPAEIEPVIYKEWEQKQYFSARADSEARPYVIVIPPPNVTGSLHMGHALNNTIQDILIRWKRMQGFNSLWVPGTDHAGIATQNVVEKDVIRQGTTRHELGREHFIQKVWEWKQQYGCQIIKQLESLGASCDWSRLNFTMNENFSRAVLTAFVKLYEKGLIYKGKRIINWCPRCTTALSDEEVEHEDTEGKLYYIKYPLAESSEFIEVATTRPETMLGDTAVAVGPSDNRYKNAAGKTARLPFMNRLIPVITDSSVDKEFGTGAVKVTPSHDPNDFALGKKHNLQFITVMDEQGIMNENAGEFKGLDRFAAREKIVKELKEQGLLTKIESYKNRVGHCYRCNTIVEPYISDQWFVKMKPLAEPAIRAVEKGSLRIFPERWTKVYLQWLYDIRDWCISRQIWWGHRIPVWYCENGCPPIVDFQIPDGCPHCKNNKLARDPDVLDTWFSSWLWPFGVFGWPDKTKDLQIFYPTNTLVTAPEILFFWVARMVMAGFEFMGKLPFNEVYLHGTVRDETGRKMSKSLGNVIDPVEIIREYGADSLRFSLISMTAAGQDVFLSPTFYVKGRNFTNKVWNASRFIFMKAEESNIDSIEINILREELTCADKWILLLLNELIEKVTVSLENFKFNEAINLIYDFFWHKFCDWYIEIAKVYSDDTDYFRRINLPILLYVLANSLKLLHPFIPFATEAIWKNLRTFVKTDTADIIVSRWPSKIEIAPDKSVRETEKVIEVITAVRDLKTRFKVPLKTMLTCYYEGTGIDEETKKIFPALAGISGFGFFPDPDSLKEDVIVRNFSIGRFGLSFNGIINVSTEIQKLEAEKEKLLYHLSKIRQKLTNEQFLSKAPKNIISQQQAKEQELTDKITKTKEDIQFLSSPK